MGIKKRTIETYVCDNKRCGKEGEDAALFATDVPVMKGTVKDKIVLCRKGCLEEHEEFMSRYSDTEETQVDDYDPTTDRAFSKYTAEQAQHHRAAKLWAVGPKSTMKGNERPKGLKGPAVPKVIDAYDAYLKALKDEAMYGVAAATDGQAAT